MRARRPVKLEQEGEGHGGERPQEPKVKALHPAVLQKGDEVQCEIEGLGIIINKVV